MNTILSVLPSRHSVIIMLMRSRTASNGGVVLKKSSRWMPACTWCTFSSMATRRHRI